MIMLAYRIWQELEAGWKELNLTVKEGLEHLKSLGTVNIKLPGGKELLRITQPNEICSELLEALQIKLPDTLEKNQSIVHTYKELSRKI